MQASSYTTPESHDGRSADAATMRGALTTASLFSEISDCANSESRVGASSADNLFETPKPNKIAMRLIEDAKEKLGSHAPLRPVILRAPLYFTPETTDGQEAGAAGADDDDATQDGASPHNRAQALALLARVSTRVSAGEEDEEEGGADGDSEEDDEEEANALAIIGGAMGQMIKTVSQELTRSAGRSMNCKVRELQATAEWQTLAQGKRIADIAHDVEGISCISEEALVQARSAYNDASEAAAKVKQIEALMEDASGVVNARLAGMDALILNENSTVNTKLTKIDSRFREVYHDLSLSKDMKTEVDAKLKHVHVKITEIYDTLVLRVNAATSVADMAVTNSRKYSIRAKRSYREMEKQHLESSTKIAKLESDLAQTKASVDQYLATHKASVDEYLAAHKAKYAAAAAATQEGEKAQAQAKYQLQLSQSELGAKLSLRDSFKAWWASI